MGRLCVAQLLWPTCQGCRNAAKPFELAPWSHRQRVRTNRLSACLTCWLAPGCYDKLSTCNTCKSARMHVVATLAGLASGVEYLLSPHHPHQMLAPASALTRPLEAACVLLLSVPLPSGFLYLCSQHCTSPWSQASALEPRISRVVPAGMLSQRLRLAAVALLASFNFVLLLLAFGRRWLRKHPSLLLSRPAVELAGV